MQEAVPVAAPRVLLCSPCGEDERFVAGVLKDVGVEVVQTDSPLAVLDLAAARCFHLVLLDLESDPQWPSTLQALRAVAPEAAVVVYSRLPDERRWIEALEAGAADYMAKPFCARDLLWVFRNTVGRVAADQSSMS